MSESGYIYVLYNEVFAYYGENVYKIGKAREPESRLRSYTTAYLHPSRFLYVSKKFNNCDTAESIIFDELKLFRIEKNREFFGCDLKTIKNTIKHVHLTERFLE